MTTSPQSPPGDGDTLGIMFPTTSDHITPANGVDPNLRIDKMLAREMFEQAYDVYAKMFTHLNRLAVQRHLMTRHEFAAVAVDTRIDKYLYFDGDGTLCGVATLTNDLAAIPGGLVSTEYFQHRWPAEYDRRALWYIPFMAVNPRGSEIGAFDSFLAQMWRVVASSGGKVALDTCRLNDEQRHLPQRILDRLNLLTTNPRMRVLDRQTYFLYEFPPLPELGENL